eukprot:1133970-Pelagomonas_calceolata.AAC.1
MVELVVFNGFPIPGHQWGDGCSKLVMKVQQSQVNVRKIVLCHLGCSLCAEPSCRTLSTCEQLSQEAMRK